MRPTTEQDRPAHPAFPSTERHARLKRLYLRLPPGPLDERNSRQWALLLVAAAAAIALIPFFLFGQASGHDIDFHLTSWVEAARQWHEGIIFPRWAALANFGYGEPRFIFYPPISWLAGAALGSVLPWEWAPTVFIFLCLVAAGLSMHRLARGWLSPRGAVAASLIYAVNPYHLVNIYLRSDFAELAASAMFPLAVFYVLADGSEGRDPSGAAGASAAGTASAWRNSVWLALVYAAIWLTNAPAAVIATYALVFLLALRAGRGGSFAPILRGGIALALGFALAGVYVIPAKLEQPWVNIAQVVSPGLSFAENFLFTWTLDPEHNLFNLQVSFIAMLLLALTGIGAVLARTLKTQAETRAEERTRAEWADMLALAALATFLLFPLSRFAWQRLPELQFVQFPWRWLFPLAVSMAFFLGAAFDASPPRAAVARAGSGNARLQAALASTLLALWIGSGAWLASVAFWNSDQVADDLEMVNGTPAGSLAQPAGYDGTDEYCPYGADNYSLSHSGPLVAPFPAPSPAPSSEEDSDAGDSANGARSAPLQPRAATVLTADVEIWAPEHKLFNISSPFPVRAALRLLNYPAWQVRVNGRRAAAETDDTTGQMLVPLAAGKNQVEVRFTRTRDRTAGGAASLLAALLWLGMLLASKRGRQTGEAGQPPASDGRR